MFFNRTKGYINYFKLNKWWKQSFTSFDRKYIESKFSALGSSITLTKGKILSTDLSLIMLIVSLIDYFDAIKDKNIILKFIQLGDARLKTSSITDQHFFHSIKSKFLYKLRKEDDEFLRSSITSAKDQVSLSTKASRSFKSKFGSPLPAHEGYKRLAIYYEQNKQYELAISYCEKALKQGWKGEWEKRIERIKNKT